MEKWLVPHMDYRHGRDMRKYKLTLSAPLVSPVSLFILLYSPRSHLPGFRGGERIQMPYPSVSCNPCDNTGHGMQCLSSPLSPIQELECSACRPLTTNTRHGTMCLSSHHSPIRDMECIVCRPLLPNTRHGIHRLSPPPFHGFEPCRAFLEYIMHFCKQTLS